MAARPKRRFLFYLRRSTSGQKLSFRTQLEWAVTAAIAHGFTPDVTMADVERMQRMGLTSYKCIRIDDAVSGAVLDRPGFSAVREEVDRNREISHVFVYRRDRLARPQDATEMVRIELDIRRKGVTFVLISDIAGPIEPGESNLGEELKLYVEYFQSGEFLRQLAERVISALRTLAVDGFRTGGNAPYGCVRVLVDASGKEIMELPRGRRARQPGCHVRIRVHDSEKILVWLRILDLRHAGWGGKRIANLLNKEGIPSPDAGRTRTDRGGVHYNSGKWGARTVLELSRHSFAVSLQQFGRRSEGKHRRLSDKGHRLLNDGDKLENGRERIVHNSAEVIIETKLDLEPAYNPEKWRQIQQMNDERAVSQRGVPRAKDPAKYPLACRVIDMTDDCGAIMFGRTSGKRRMYTCGRYQQYGDCEHNQIDAEALLKWTLGVISEHVAIGGRQLEKLRVLLLDRAQAAYGDGGRATSITRERELRQRRDRLLEDRQICGRRMATEKDDGRHLFLAEEFDRISAELGQAEKTLSVFLAAAPAPGDPEADVDAAMRLLQNMQRIVGDESARKDMPQLFRQLGLQIGLTFVGVIKGTKRPVRKLASGVMAFGGAELPVKLHGRLRVDPSQPAEQEADDCLLTTNVAQRGQESSSVCDDSQPASPPGSHSSHQEGVSSTKVSRGDMI